MEKLSLSFMPGAAANTPLSIGATANGDVIGATAHHLIRDGKPWYPVMGEFHYSRYPAEEWEIELRKMKALGIQVVATYVFWIHHEEEKGVWRTDGDLDLHRFILTCQKVGLEVLLHIGFTGDHADLYLDGLLIADWYTTGQPWKVALKRHGYPQKLELRVYPVVNPTYFEIPVPQDMTLDSLQAQPLYAVKL